VKDVKDVKEEIRTFYKKIINYTLLYFYFFCVDSIKLLSHLSHLSHRALKMGVPTPVFSTSLSGCKDVMAAHLYRWRCQKMLLTASGISSGHLRYITWPPQEAFLTTSGDTSDNA